MADTIVNADYTLVQTVTTLPALDSGWTSRPEIIAIRGTEGVGQFIGSMEVEMRAGLRTLPGASNAMVTQAIASYIGQYLRVLYHNQSTGTITVSGKNYDCIWTGVVVSQTTVPDGATATPGGTQTFHCAGIASILDGIYINSGLSYAYKAGVIDGPWDPGFCPLFNALPSKNNNTLGERSAATVHYISPTPARDIYIFNLVTPANPWTAFQVVDHLLANFAQVGCLPPSFTFTGPSWTVVDPLGCLNYVPDKLDFNGKPLLECINSLINPRRGCTWRATMNANAVVITVYSTARTSVTVGAFVFPASTTTNSLDSRGNQLFGGLTIDEDVSAKFDYIQVEGNQPLAGISLYFKTDDSGSLIKGWDSSLEATWDPTINQGPQYANVWRRYLLRDSWNGSQYKDSVTVGLRAARTAASGGYTGARTFAIGAGDFTAPAKMLSLEKFIPLPANQDYTTTPAVGSLDMTSPLLAPMLFVKDSVYSDITDDYSISVEENPAAITIDGDLDSLVGYLTSSAEFVITVGIREVHPLMVSWQSGSFTGEVPRVMVRRIPYCEQWVALKDTVVGVNAGAAFYTLSGSLTVVDDLDKLKAWLAVLQTWYGYTAVTATWTDHSKIDYASGNGTYQPGALLTTVHRGDSALTCNAIIATRAWDFTLASFGTSYTTERVIPDIASIETHPRINKIFKSNAERDSLE